MDAAGNRSVITEINPMGTDGFEFIEFFMPEPAALDQLFSQLGFKVSGCNRSGTRSLYQQGDISFIINTDTSSASASFYSAHGPCASAFGIRVADAGHALKRALSLGAEQGQSEYAVNGQKIPCIVGIGGCLLYLVDCYGDSGSMYQDDFQIEDIQLETANNAGLELLDHVTHNVYRGNMDKWAGFYEKLFNFQEVRYFDIEGKLTGLKSRAMTSPCGKIKIPINESSDDKSQIEEYLQQYKGEGIQHIALTARDIYAAVDQLADNGLQFMTPPPDTYYEMLSERLPWHGEKCRSAEIQGYTARRSADTGRWFTATDFHRNGHRSDLL